LTERIRISEWDWIWGDTVHCGIFGTTGSGKSSIGEYLAETFYDASEKVIDFFDEGRLENAFYRFPEDRPELIRVNRKLIPDWKPRSFPVEVWFPRYCGKEVTRQVPEYFKAFTLPLSDLSTDDLKTLMGLRAHEWTFAGEAMIDRALAEIEPEDDFWVLIEKVLQGLKRGIIRFDDEEIPIGDRRSVFPMVRRLYELQQMGIISSHEDPRCIDFKQLLADKDQITSFTVYQIASIRVRYGIWAYLLRKILDTKRVNVGLPRTVLFIREVRNLAPSKLGVFADATYTRRNLARIAREGRDVSIRLLVDSQRFMDVDIDLRSQIEFLILLRIYWSDVQEATSSVFMDWSTQLKIQRLERGVGCFIGRGMYRYPVTLPVSLSKHKQENQHLFQVCEQYGVPLLEYRPEAILGMSSRRVEQVLTLKSMPDVFDAGDYLDRNSMPPGTASWLLSAFAKQGLLEHVERGRYRIPPETRDLIAKLENAPN
jgi:hypothetical protein